VKNNYNLLKWDTEHFGYKIASVRSNKLEFDDLKILIDELTNNDFKLVYFYVNPSDEISNNSLRSISGFLADEKITFGIQLKKDDSFIYSPFIKPYKLDYSSEKLKVLALQSGTYSRFKLDKEFVNDEYKKLYIEWIDNSVRKVIADEILVYYKNDEEKGLVTLVSKKATGFIGLIAVDEKERGNSIGKELMNASLFVFKEKGINNIEVVTQKANRIACEFYKALGFTVKNVENVFHLWIK
jgi:dTDP-4-amino-4,6-dideoxy-D-galactose acyltransferase